MRANEEVEIDPVDGGPKMMTPPPPPPDLSPGSGSMNKVLIISQEDEARQAIEMLRSEEVADRVTAATRLEAVAAALGQERTRNELLPFLADGMDDEDDVLIAIAKSLGNFVDYVGGSQDAEILLPLLQTLLTVEEHTVREVASVSTNQVAARLPRAVFQGSFATMISGLATSEWFTARTSAASLISSTYPRLNVSQQEDFLQHFATLCRDDSATVRQVAAQYLGSMLNAVVDVEGRGCWSELGEVTVVVMPLYELLAANEQPDAVRLKTAENCVTFGKLLGAFAPDFTSSEISLIQRIVPLILATIDDRSWRVRWTAASKFGDVIAGFDKLPGVMDSLIPAYEKLLQDPEAEVRTAATYNLAAVAACKALVLHPVGREWTSSIRISAAERLVKQVTNLTEDDSEHVRAALAMVATDLAPILGKDATISHLVPPVLLLLRDTASEVRLNLISSLSALNEVVGVDLLSQSLLPAILDLAHDSKWRIRLSILTHIPLLAKQLGIDFFTEKLLALCIGWLTDSIATIRTAATQNLSELASLFGTEWTVEYLLPSIEEIRRHVTYMRRLTAVQAYSLISPKIQVEVVIRDILPVILEMALDDVANIRLNVCKALEEIAVVCGQTIYTSEIRQVLGILEEDVDRDVRFFAVKATKRIDHELTGKVQR